MRASEKLREDANHIWNKIFEHPFVVQLYEGTLPREKFIFYILQDYTYLTSAIKNFSIMASRAESVGHMREVVEITHLEATSEFKGYEEFLKRLGYTLEDAARCEPAFVTVSYASFLIATSSLKSFPESIAASLPCFWSYAEIANYHREKLRDKKGIYADWARVYLSKPYLDLVEKIRNLMDEIGKGFPYEKLKDTFITATRYEYMFWDSAYNMGAWPV